MHARLRDCRHGMVSQIHSEVPMNDDVIIRKYWHVPALDEQLHVARAYLAYRIRNSDRCKTALRDSWDLINRPVKQEAA